MDISASNEESVYRKKLHLLMLLIFWILASHLIPIALSLWFTMLYRYFMQYFFCNVGSRKYQFYSINIMVIFCLPFLMVFFIWRRKRKTITVLKHIFYYIDGLGLYDALFWLRKYDRWEQKKAWNRNFVVLQTLSISHVANIKTGWRNEFANSFMWYFHWNKPMGLKD